MTGIELSEIKKAAIDVGVEIGLPVRDADVTLDERQDGEPVTRLVLLLDDPEGDTGTWIASALFAAPLGSARSPSAYRR